MRPMGEDTGADELLAEVRTRLGELDGAATTEHVAVFDAVHRHLAQTLAHLDEDPGRG